MNLELFFLGTGASVPSRARNLPALGIRRGGRSILVDCGEGTQRQILSTPISLTTLEAILITHVHGDHILGLPGALLSMEFAGRTSGLSIYGPRGSTRILSALLRPFGLSFSVSLAEIEPEVEVEGILGCSIRATRVDHRGSAVAYRLDEPDRPGRFDRDRAQQLGVPSGPLYGCLQRGEAVTLENGERINPELVMGPARSGRSIVVSGDTAYCPGLAEFAKDASVLVHEATFGNELEELAGERGHSTARQAATIARDGRVGRLFLVHISPRYHERSLLRNLVGEARELFPETKAPNDFDRYEVPFDDEDVDPDVPGKSRPWCK